MKSKATGPSELPASNRKPPAGGAVALPFRRPKTRAGIDLGKLKERIDSLPDMDAARLVELHNRLETKSLELDAHEIADKMLDLERWLESILGKEG